MAGLGFSIAAAETSPIMPDSFVNEVLIHRRAENRIVEVDRANYLITKIENVNCCHDYRLALRTRNIRTIGTRNSTLHEHHVVIRVDFDDLQVAHSHLGMTHVTGSPHTGEHTDGKLEAPIEPGAR